MKSGTNSDNKSSNPSFDMFRNVRLFIAALLIILAGIVLWKSGDLNRPDNRRILTVYCFTGMEEVMENAIFPAFKDFWQEKTGENVEFIATFAGSGDITRKIISRFPVEIAVFASELDALQLSNRGTVFARTQCHGIRLKLIKSGTGARHKAQIKQFEVIYTEGPMSHEAAITRERQLKKWSRAKKLALASGDLNQLRQLSRC